jgi:ABC-2 type transport system ATP-binding protein
MNTSLDELRQSYRRIDFVFPSTPLEREFCIAGVEKIQTAGHQLSLFASRNADALVERGHDLGAVSIQVAPVGLRDIFLETVKEN